MNLVNYKSLSYLNMNLGSKPRIGHKSKQQRNNANSFDGQMQQLILNGKSYFELVENENLV